MFKLAILLSIVALASASDYDAIIGEAVSAAFGEAFNHPIPNCPKFTITRSDVKCNCNDKKDLPVIELSREGLPVAIKLIPFKVTNDEEATAVFKIDSNDCECGPDVYPDITAFKIINDNYFVTYGKKPRKGKLVMLNRKNPSTKAEFDEAVKAAGLEGTKLTVTCNTFTD